MEYFEDRNTGFIVRPNPEAPDHDPSVRAFKDQAEAIRYATEVGVDRIEFVALDTFLCGLPRPTQPRWWQSDIEPSMTVERLGRVAYVSVEGQWVRLALDEHDIHIRVTKSETLARVMIHCDSPPLAGGWVEAVPEVAARP